MKGKNRESRIGELLEEVRKWLYDAGDRPLKKNGLWEAYAKLEYAILLLKFDHDFETPGGFEFTNFRRSDEAEMLKLTINHLEKGKDALGNGSIKGAMNHLRRARDTLKVLVLRR